MITQIDKINANEYLSRHEWGRYVCTCCERATSLSESISYKGFNLICNKCASKMHNVLSHQQTINEMVQEKGLKKQLEYITLRGF